jgi:Matrixin
MNEPLTAYNKRTVTSTYHHWPQIASSEREAFSDDTQNDNNIKTVKVIDYVQEAPESERQSDLDSVPFVLPFESLDKRFTSLAVDPCGDGTNTYSLQSGGVKWMKFPVKYYIDPSGIGSTTLTADSITTAVRNAFKTFNAEVPYTFLSKTAAPTAAKIKVQWEYIDGPLKQVGYASYSYNTATKELISAKIVFDSGDKWFISPVHRCGGIGSSLDIQNVATHELGHAIGLGHVTDKLLTMYPVSMAGETLKRILGNGDKRGVDFLY